MCSFDVLLELCYSFLPPLGAQHPDVFLCLVLEVGNSQLPRLQETAVQGLSRIFKGVKDNSEAAFATSGEESLPGCSGEEEHESVGGAVAYSLAPLFQGGYLRQFFCEFQAGASTYCKLHTDKTCYLKSQGDFLLRVTPGSRSAKTLRPNLVGCLICRLLVDVSFVAFSFLIFLIFKKYISGIFGENTGQPWNCLFLSQTLSSSVSS